MAREARRNTAPNAAPAEAARAEPARTDVARAEAARTDVARAVAPLGAIALLRFELFVRDTERSIRFYEDALGFNARSRARDGSSRYTELTNGAVRIGIAPIAALPQNHHFRRGADDRLGVGVEIVFEVHDISEYERRARLAGAVFEPLQHRPWGRRDFRVVDPDGYYIRVTETLRDGTRAGAAGRREANGGFQLS